MDDARSASWSSRMRAAPGAAITPICPPENQRLRVHYLLEAELEGRHCHPGPGAHQSHQPGPAAAVPAGRDRRQGRRSGSCRPSRESLDTLGAITKGQRQTGGQGLFRADDNLESVHARAALRQFYGHLYNGKIDGCSLQAFQDATGLSLTNGDGTLKEELPPITTFLNRLLALTITMQNLLFEAFDAILRAKIEGAIAAGSYDAGVETIRAAAMTINDRRTVHVHEATGAETRVFTIERKDRNEPLSLDEALARSAEKHAKLLVNAKSGRAAVQVPTASLMLDDGEVEHRVRLLRPTERHAIGLEALGQTHWEETDRDGFVAAWTSELAEVPEFSTSTFHVVTGLLLPIWKRIPDETCKVYRLQTDDGERVIGRLISSAGLAVLYRNLGQDGAPAMNAGDAWATVLDGRGALRLADGLQLRRARVMNDHRVELTGFTEGMRDRLRAMGLFSEIIAWKLRFFVPVGTAGPEILRRLLERHPLIGVVERDAA